MKKKQISAIFIAVLFGGSFLAYALNYAMPSQQSRQRRSRAYLGISLCNERGEIPEVAIRRKDLIFNSSSDGMIEFSGEKIKLGKVFNLLNITFSSDRLMNYTNDNGCPDLPSNEVHLHVRSYNQNNFRMSNKYRDYMVENGDVIRVSYY